MNTLFTLFYVPRFKIVLLRGVLPIDALVCGD